MADQHQYHEAQRAWEAERRQLSQQLEDQALNLAALSKLERSHSEVSIKLAEARNELTSERAAFAERLKSQLEVQATDFQKQLRFAQSSLTSAKVELKQFQRLEVNSTRDREESRQTIKQLQIELADLQRSKDDLARVIDTKSRQSDAKQREDVPALEIVAEQLRNELRQQERRLMELELLNQELLDQLKQAANPIHSLPFASSTERKTSQKRTTASAKQSKRTSRSKRKTLAKLKIDTKIKKRDAGSKKQKTSVCRTANDDLTLITGIGPVAAKKLNRLGVKTFEQIAAWKKEDVEQFSEKISVGGRIKRDRWVQQAKKLCK